jgi:type IV secretory pathway VirB2 component (pilin)
MQRRRRQYLPSALSMAAVFLALCAPSAAAAAGSADWIAPLDGRQTTFSGDVRHCF